MSAEKQRQSRARALGFAASFNVSRETFTNQSSPLYFVSRETTGGRVLQSFLLFASDCHKNFFCMSKNRWQMGFLWYNKLTKDAWRPLTKDENGGAVCSVVAIFGQ